MQSLLQQKTWRFIDQSTSYDRSPLESFAMDDALCHLVGQGLSVPVVRTWVHDPYVVLGIQDHRMPYIQEGIGELKKAGYEAIVRNSGGLAVVLDRGILNISIVLSEAPGSISINTGYEVMLQFVKLLFPEAADQIQAYEIVGSYCPGSYDLSIGGKKFAGISQRRIRNGVAVQIYLCMEGSGSERAELIKRMYQTSLQDVRTKFRYPDIRPEVMASLSELLDRTVTVQETVIRVQQLLASLSDQVLFQPLNQDESDLYSFYLKRVLDRNLKLIGKNT
ncbi:lipoate--protein ligase family protein [Ureibacillus sp. FSL K6-8385]|uniref:Octanoyl-[GcvH]:protein N-octanoyltransferase n=1 Tax=Ureibacillus terrenus TaxID=118246 RepID=A0A540V2A0_9BACL|nr:lipoate--protein ligase family protein [Ureibacillus terrenus]MED3661329.1 lipoate--protein ligase family protein [Ureibacillus terrenus]MED3764199.1 lipoate--protein ligase family protein [Ureibacillus terrenus]TQE90848.1 octanoyltransferase [Ureibacillus terrenus]